MESNIKLNGEPTAQSLANGLATLGRYGDNYMVHAAEGETVVPGEILDANPQLKDALFSQMRSMGVTDPNRYVVGNDLNSINPITGQPEFFFKKIFKAVKKVFKKVLPVAAPIIGNLIAPGIGGLIASGLTAKLQGGSWGDALKAAGMAYAGGALTQGIFGGLSNVPGQTFMGGLTKGAMAPFQAAGNLFSSGPQNPLSQGIFGGITEGGLGTGSFYKNPTILPTYNPEAGATTLSQAGATKTGASAPETTVRVGPGGKIVIDDTYKTTSGIATTDAAKKAPFFSKQNFKDFAQTNLGSNLIVGGLGAGASYAFSDDPEVTEEDVKNMTNPQRTAYEAYLAGKANNPDFINTPEGQRLRAEAGLSPVRTREQMKAAFPTLSRNAVDRWHDLNYGKPSSGIQLASINNPSTNNLAAPMNIQPQALTGVLPQGVMAAAGGEIKGPGSGTSDSIPAMLSDGEFVMTAQAVRNAGNGDRDLGAARMYDMMNKFERAV